MVAPGAPDVPYRTQSIPQITLTCGACARAFQADVGTKPERCGPCHVAFVAANQAESARIYGAYQAGARREARNTKVWALVGSIFIGVIITMARVAMTESYKDDKRSSENDGHRLVVTDEQLRETIHGFASEMCACRDRACAKATEARFATWSETSETPATDVVGGMIATEIARMTACEDKLVR